MPQGQLDRKVRLQWLARRVKTFPANIQQGPILAWSDPGQNDPYRLDPAVRPTTLAHER